MDDTQYHGLTSGTDQTLQLFTTGQAPISAKLFIRNYNSFSYIIMVQADNFPFTACTIPSLTHRTAAADGVAMAGSAGAEWSAPQQHAAQERSKHPQALVVPAAGRTSQVIAKGRQRGCLLEQW